MFLLIPAVIGDHGFKDYQLKFGYGSIGEFPVLKWLSKIVRLDRETDSSEPQFPPIKIHGKPFNIQPSPLTENPTPFIPSPPNNPPEPNRIQTQQITEAPQVENANYLTPQSPSHDSSSKSSSADPLETPATPPILGPTHSYKDYLYMKWFHGSPKATYFNENPVPDKLLSDIDSKVQQETAASPEVPPVKFTSHHSTVDEQQPALLSFLSDSIISRMFNTIKRKMIPKIQKEDIGPLKFYDEPPKPQSFPVPSKAVNFSLQYDSPLSALNQTDGAYGSAQLFNSHLANNLSEHAVYDPANNQSKEEKPVKILSELDNPPLATTFNPPNLDYGLLETSTFLPELTYDLPTPDDNQPAELLPFNVRPQTTINAVERNDVPLQTAYSPNRQMTIDNPSAQLDEPDNSALLLAFKPQVPKYA